VPVTKNTPRLHSADTHWHIERQRIAGTALVAVRRHHGQVGKSGQGFAQREDALGAITIVITDQDLQSVFFGLGKRVNILKAPLGR
jgi:hypothetical protein